MKATHARSCDGDSHGLSPAGDRRGRGISRSFCWTVHAYYPRSCLAKPDSASQGQTQRTEQDHRSARDPSAHVTEGDRLLQQNKYGDRRDPHKVHHAADEQQCHQDPAATYAVDAEPQSHPEGAEVTAAPAAGHEMRWGPAVLQAGVLERGELV